ncbi:hypothetical protein F7725_009113, partial [Dissostichus mawsoni]
MRPHYCLTVLVASLLVEPLFTLNGASEDTTHPSPQNSHDALHATHIYDNDQYLEIKCEVVFCEKAQPTSTGLNVSKQDVPVTVSSSSHIDTQWDFIDKLEGISFLVARILNPQWMYFAAVIVPFIIIAIIISVVLMPGCKAESVPIMRPNLCWLILHVCIWAGLLLTLNADEECLIETRVHVNKSYKAVVGEQLELKCEVGFCEEAPPPVHWIKREQTDVPVNISSSSRIKTHWELINKSEGISFLVFPKYCQSGGSSSHNINVFVYGSTNSEPTVDSWMYFAAGIVPFIIIAIIISVVLMCGCKEECLIETRVHVNKSYKAVVGEQLELKCEVGFCEEAPPPVDWIKREQTDVPVTVSSSSRIKTHWELINKSEGISFLVFPKIRLTDSGVYQCQSGGSSSHNIKVFVY